MERTIYTREDCGCYADGARGSLDVDRMTVELAESHGFRAADMYAVIQASMGDAVRESDADRLSTMAEGAIDYLNTLCEEGIHFDIVDCDLLLISDAECDA